MAPMFGKKISVCMYVCLCIWGYSNSCGTFLLGCELVI